MAVLTVGCGVNAPAISEALRKSDVPVVVMNHDEYHPIRPSPRLITVKSPRSADANFNYLKMRGRWG